MGIRVKSFIKYFFTRLKAVHNEIINPSRFHQSRLRNKSVPFCPSIIPVSTKRVLTSIQFLSLAVFFQVVDASSIHPAPGLCDSGHVTEARVSSAWSGMAGGVQPNCTEGEVFPNEAAAVNQCFAIESAGHGCTFEPAGQAEFPTWGGDPYDGSGVYHYHYYLQNAEDSNGLCLHLHRAVRLQFACQNQEYFVTVPPIDGPNLGKSCGVNEGNPINAATGSKYQEEADYRSVGASSLDFTRHYNSADHRAGALGVAWHHSYSRRLRPEYQTYPAHNPSSPTNSDLYYAKEPACRLGWEQIRSRAVSLANTTAVYANGVCTLYESGQRRGTLPIRSNAQPASTIVAWHAERPDGSAYRFQGNSGTLIPQANVTATLSKTTGGFVYVENDTTETYDDNGRLLFLSDRAGRQQTLSYNAQGNLSGISDSFGRQLGFGYDGQGRIATLTDPDNKSYGYAYDAAGNLASVTYPDNKTRVYHYEYASVPHALTGITDENGDRYATWSYDAQGRATSSTHADGADNTTLVYNANGSTTITDALGLVRTRTFTLLHGVYKPSSTNKSCGGCGGSTASTTYDANGFVSSRTDFNGHVIQYTHDARGLETSRTEAAGTPQARTITTAWHASFRLPLEVNEPGRRTEYTYDANGNRLTQTATDTGTGESRTTTYGYIAQGLVSSIDGARSDVADATTLAYDSQGNLTSITNALNQVTQITSHDAHGNPLTIIDPNGVTTTLTYDLRQRPLSRTVAGATTGFDYDDAGNLTKLTLPTGTFISYAYDAAHRLTDIQDNFGNKIHYTLDDAGNRTAEKVYDPGNNLKRQLNQEYDSQSRLKKILGANGQVTQWGYDAQGNRTSSTEAGSFVTGSQYDALDRVFKVTDAANGETTYTYNALDQLTSVTDPKGLVTSYAVNAFGEVTQQTSPDTAVTSYTYDKAGNRKSQIDARGITVNYSYDALNRLTLQDYPGTTEDVIYSYDGSNYGTATAHGIGRLTGIQDQSGATTRVYDPRGTLKSQTKTIMGRTNTTHYTYDAADRMTSMTYPTGRVVNYPRNELGQVNSVATTATGGAPQMLAEDIEYLPYGPDARLSLGNGLVETRSYDLDYRVTQIRAGGLQDLSYFYDARNNVDAIQNGLDANRSQGFDYDALSRLTQAQGIYGILAYSYDAVGNRLNEMDDGVVDSYTYSPGSHRLQSIGNSSSTTTFSYDAVGNTTAKGAQTFAYNQAGRMSRATLGNSSTSYTYNAQGQRAIKTGSSTSIFHYDQTGQLIAETDAQGGLIRELVYLNGRPLVTYAKVTTVTPAQLAPELTPTLASIFAIPLFKDPALKPLLQPLQPTVTTRIEQGYVHTDHLGTPQLVTGPNQQSAWKADYEPFGQTIITINSLSQNQRYPGQYSDSESGLYQNWWREYDPATDRYLQFDPIGLGGGINGYIYANANPLRFVDPLGLKTCVLVTRGSSGIANHSALFTSQGSEGGPFLYDPAGAYARAHGGGSGDLIDDASASMEGFAKFHRDNFGDTTESVCKETTKEEEEKFLSSAEAQPVASAFGCASAVSDVIGGSRTFPKVEPGTFYPGNLIKDARRRR